MVIISLLSVLAPAVAAAFPFGGRITVYHVCYNETIFARLSPPVPGDYVWTRSTRTYQFGPPRNVGQWLLGLTSIPYDCLWSVSPIYVQPAIAIMMMGSSGAAAPMYTPPSAEAPPSNVMQVKAATSAKAPTAAKAPGSVAAPDAKAAETVQADDPFITNQDEVPADRVLITEVFYNVDAVHGKDPDNEWVEIYNGTNATVSLSGWSIQNSGGSDTIPAGVTLGSKKYLVIVPSSEFLTYWPSATSVSLGSLLGSGLANAGDVVRLKNNSNLTVDAVSWGTNTSAFSPAVKTVPKGYSMARTPATIDTDKASNWISRASPTPGR